MDTKVKWDRDHLNALLGIRRYPFHLIQEEPWSSWIQKRGGAQAVRAYLRGCADLDILQKRLLESLIDNPGARMDTHAENVGLERSRLFDHLNRLVPFLI